MPGFTTHYLFGLNTYKHLNGSALKKTIYGNHSAYSLGLQGPDVFFYFLLSYTIRRRNIGSIAHTESTSRFLRHLLDSRKLFQKEEEQHIAEAYIAGFLGHYVLDTQCHPYVYWKTNFQKKCNRYYSSHMSLETDIDRELLMREKHCRPSAFRQDATIALTKEQAHVIATILSYVYGKTYPKLGVFHITMHAAIRSMQLGTRFLNDPSGKKKRIIEQLETWLLGHPMLSTMIPSDTRVVHPDPLNLQKKEWKNPWDTSFVSHETFFDLMETAQEKYLGILASLEQLYALPFQPLAAFGKQDKNSRKAAIPAELAKRNQLLKKLGNNSYHSGLDAAIPS